MPLGSRRRGAGTTEVRECDKRGAVKKGITERTMAGFKVRVEIDGKHLDEGYLVSLVRS
jgi:hypothetical protein